MKYQLLCGDAIEQLRKLPDNSVNTCVTSPPYYGLRDYGNNNQIGLEKTPKEYIAKLVEVFREVKRVLRDDGILWVNIGDSYYHTTSNNGGYSNKSTLQGFTKPDTKGRIMNETGNRTRLNMEGIKPKDLIGIPWMLAFALRADGWYLRQDVIWAKNNPMPESVKDRCTRSHEHIFLLSKRRKYYFDHEAMQEDADSRDTEKRNKRDVWRVPVCSSVKEAHFAVYPPELITPCVLAGCPAGGTVLDPFSGSGTTGIVAVNNGRNYIGIELNPDYVNITVNRVNRECRGVEVDVVA